MNLPRQTRILLIIFFFSGFAALMYQVIWQRWLVFYTGISSLSISLIVSAFMAGLGLGYWFGGQWADKTRKPLYLFMLAELGIGAFALASKYLLYDWLYVQQGITATSTWAIYSCLFALLLFPTFLMGLSLPLLSKTFKLANATDQAHHISRLYFINTLGAAIGAILTSFFFIRGLGFAQTIWLGASLNALCALLAWILFRNITQNQPSHSMESSNSASFSIQKLAPWMVHYFLSGFMAISLEIVWFRIIETLMKPLALTFSLILGIYLATMAIGTWLGIQTTPRWIHQKMRIFLRLQYALYGYALVSVVTLWFALPHMTTLFDFLRGYDFSLSPSILIYTVVIIPLFLMAVPTFLMGFSFTVSQVIIQDEYEAVGRKVGWLQGVNIIGSTAGSWFVSLVGFNYLGTALTLQIIGSTILLYALVGWKTQETRRITLGILGLFFVCVVSVFPTNHRLWMVFSGMQDPDRFILQENDTALSIIKINEDKTAWVFINGLGQSLFPYHLDENHVILGAFPSLFHPNPERIAIIGLGSASTLFNASGRIETKHIDCYEVIENQPKVLEKYMAMSGYTIPAVALNDPRGHIQLQDGRYALHHSTEQYDIIEADALRPRSSFSGNLYSVEYFQLVKSKLKPGGLAITWGATDRIVNSIKEVFPYVYRVNGFMVMGSTTPVQRNWSDIQASLSHSFTKNHFQKAQIPIDTLIQKGYESIEILQNGQVTQHRRKNTDMWPRDEYDLGRIWSFLGD